MGVAEELIERARTGVPAGECAIAVEGGTLRLAVLLRPAVPMSHYMGILPVCALGALEGLRPLRDDLALAWPGNVVVPDEDGHATQVRVRSVSAPVRARAACSWSARQASSLPRSAAMASGELAHAVCSAVALRVDAWAADVSAGRRAAGPWHRCSRTTSMPLRSWGARARSSIPTVALPRPERSRPWTSGARATVRLADGRELVVSPEQASLR